MTVQDIKEMADAFADAAARAKTADFDGVQIHAAHGSLLSLRRCIRR
jgi:2,4-dienoyl-CoA reductase-like NADH-dependent reductase (Old Yellow Enzyme family)